MFYEHKHCKATESASHNCIYGSDVFHPITTHKAILPIRLSQNCCDVRMCGAPRVLAQVVGTSEPVAKDVTKKEAGGELLALSDCLCVEQL